MTDALFVVDGDAVTPTEFSRGPWSPDALHGGPVAALIARAAEAIDARPDLHVSRLTIELLRPVPLAPLEVSATMSRPGHKVQVVDVTIATGGVDVAWGRALRIRTLPDAPDGDPLADTTASESNPDAPPGPDRGHHMMTLNDSYTGFVDAGAEVRFVQGHFATPGRASAWVRLAVPVVGGEEPSPLQRVAAAADFGNGFSSVLDFGRFLFINPDLTISVTRPAVGEWICLEASTELGITGTGVAQSRLWDSRGVVGHALQSLFVDRRAEIT